MVELLFSYERNKKDKSFFLFFNNEMLYATCLSNTSIALFEPIVFHQKGWSN